MHIILILDIQILKFIHDLYNEYELWSDFENALGCPQKDFLNRLINLFRMDLTISNYKQLKSAFEKWVNSLDINDSKPMFVFENLFSGDNNFITFNYTSTLELLYQKEEGNIIHIHGNGIKFIRGLDKIIFGHNKKVNNNDCNLVKNTFKDTNKILSQNKEKIDSFLKVASEIIVIGFSYNDIDYPYFEYFGKYSNNFIWTFYCYNEKDKNNALNYKAKLNLNDNNCNIMIKKF